jgi:plastocyanin
MSIRQSIVVLGVLLMAAPAGWAMSPGQCQCNVSVIAGATGLTLTSGAPRGPCGREMSIGKVSNVQKAARSAAATALRGAFGVSAPGGEAAAGSATSVTVGDSFFDATPVTINVGDTVHWDWVGFGTHTVTSVAGSAEVFDSGFLSGGGSFEHTFTKVGTFNYYCLLHGFDVGGGGVPLGMAGSITVKATPEPAAGLLLPAMAVLLARRRRARPV